MPSVPMHKKLFVIIGPLLCVGVLFGTDLDPANPAVTRTLAVAVLMAFYWLTDAIPMAATALIPVVLFPFLGVLKGGEVAPLYVNNIIFLFIGGFLIAIAMERWNLHKRIALRIILTIGKSPAWLLFGFMGASWFLSQWISNTATTLMMVPIVMALAVKFEERFGTPARALTVAMLLGIAYASSIGGMATLIGTAPNLAFARILTLSFPGASEVTFLGWMVFALPLSFILFLLTYFFLKTTVLRGVDFELDRGVLEQEHHALGPLSYEEKLVLGAFVTFMVLIVTRGDVNMGGRVIRGWASIIGVDSFVGDGTVSVTVAFLLFLLPARSRNEFVLDAGAISRLPWDIIILLGGGFALARAFQTSGLSEFLGQKLTVLGSWHPILFLMVLCTFVTFLTELTSNTATTQVILPIIASLCAALGIHPYFLMVPTTISASCAFMLPVATPPNAIVFGTHRLRVFDMARTGVFLNLIGIATITLLTYVLGRIVFNIDLGSPPDWMR